MDAPRASNKTWILVGVGVGALISAFVFFLMRRQRPRFRLEIVDYPEPGALHGALHGVQGQNLFTALRALSGAGAPLANGPLANQAQLPIPVVQAPTARTNRDLRSSSTLTYTLSTTSITRVFDGGSQRHWSVEVRTIGPPGARAYISTDNSPSSFPMAASIIPAGAYGRFKIRPGDALFGVGDVAGVQISVIASEDLA